MVLLHITNSSAYPRIQCEQKIAPLFNRVVVFNTDEDSYHGLPDPLMCPDGESRKSIALYYYSFAYNSALGFFIAGFILFLSAVLSIKTALDYTNNTFQEN